MGKITIRDVAREAGVSISLVSLVMNAKRDAEGNLDCNVNKDTARRIAEVAKRLGYRPNKAAASLRSGRFYTIGMVTSDIANQFFADIARYIENIAHNYNYTVLFGSSDENAEKLDNIVDTFIGNGVEGLIVAPCSGSEEVLRKALDAGIPTVLLDRRHRGTRCRARDAGQRAGRADGRGTPLRERLPPYRDDLLHAGYFEPFGARTGLLRGHAPLRIGGLFADPLHGLRPCAGGYGAHLRGRRAAGCGGVPAADQYAGPAGLAGAQRTEPLGARRPRAGGLRRKRDLLSLQTFGHLHHPIHPQAGRAVVRDAAAHDRRRRRLSQRGDRTRTDRRGIYRLHSSRTGRGGQGTCCGRRGTDAARLRTAPGNLFPAQGRLDGRSPVHGADGVELPLGTRSGYAGRGRRDEDRNSAERPVPHLRADEELDGPLGRQGEACPRRLPPPHRRPRLRHALRYGRSRMALAGGRYDLPYGGRPPSRAARSGGIRRALRRHPLHAARRGARPIRSKRSSGCATTCSACPPNPKSGGRSISSSRAAAWPACAPPLRRHGRGCAWR